MACAPAPYRILLLSTRSDGAPRRQSLEIAVDIGAMILCLARARESCSWGVGRAAFAGGQMGVSITTSSPIKRIKRVAWKERNPNP
jgi:hypothetical protein